MELSPVARRVLDKLPDKDFRRIDTALIELGDSPRPQGVKKLKGAIHRIRIGSWRVIYVIDDAARLVSVLDILRRSERTYKALP